MGCVATVTPWYRDGTMGQTARNPLDTPCAHIPLPRTPNGIRGVGMGHNGVSDPLRGMDPISGWVVRRVL